jgi:exopolyphosphatase/guanosine-5'-triphosphate,3'-diphosphate pyrophosphatase
MRRDSTLYNPQFTVTIAVIDIGTNTVLLLVAQLDEEGHITPLAYEQRVPRLGKGVDAHRNLQPDAMTRAVGVLREFSEILNPFRPSTTIVCGTSAIRDAANRDAFTALVKQAAGYDLEVLSGEDEAYWTYRGAISGIPEITQATVVDIGGGSTEITIGDRERILSSVSLNIGSVRLTERLFAHDPPTDPELERAIELVENELARCSTFNFRASVLVGVAGTATSLAILAQGLRDFSAQAVMGYRMSAATVEHLFGTLRAMKTQDIRALSAIMEGRADVITAGTLILREVMMHFRFEEMIVSERGVRYGLAIREWEKQRR